MTPLKVALVTGSGKKRVGNAVARELARAGYAVAVHYHTSVADAAETVTELTVLGVRAAAFRANVADEAEVAQMIDAVNAEFGRLDVLVNSAAIWNRKLLEAVTAADVRDHFDANTLGTFLCAKAAGLRMVLQPEGGCIINIGDWAEVRPYLHYAAYFPSKGGVSAMTRSLAVELGTRNPNVRVNAVLPGPVMLPPNMSAAEREQTINATLVKRLGTPEHVAKAVLSLIDNDFITGVCLPVDGGRTIYAPEG